MIIEERVTKDKDSISFCGFLAEQLKHAKAEQIASWMKSGDITVPQYRTMQDEMLRRKSLDKKPKVVPTSPPRRKK